MNRARCGLLFGGWYAERKYASFDEKIVRGCERCFIVCRAPTPAYPSLDDTNGLQTKENVLAAAGGWQKKTARSFRTGMGSRIPLLRHPPSPSSQAAKQGSKWEEESFESVKWNKILSPQN